MKIMLILMIITSTSYYTMLLFKYLTLFSCFLSFAKEFKFNTEIKIMKIQKNLWRINKINEFGESMTIYFGELCCASPIFQKPVIFIASIIICIKMIVMFDWVLNKSLFVDKSSQSSLQKHFCLSLKYYQPHK